MPQTMPMFWTTMIFLTMIMLLMTIILMYFFTLPKLNYTSQPTMQLNHWNWMW